MWSVLGVVHIGTLATGAPLRVGEVRTLTFGPTNMLFIGAGYQSSGGRYFLAFGNSDRLDSSEQLTVEMFDDSLSDIPISTLTFAGGPDTGLFVYHDEAGAWQDFQGAVRVTMVSGSVDLDGLSLSVYKDGARYDYSSDPQPAPGPPLFMQPGDIYTRSFDTLPFSSQFPSPTRPEPYSGELEVTVYNAPQLPDGTSLRIDMFENDLSEAPVCSKTVAFPSANISFLCRADNAWQDVQGAFRLTMLGGSAKIDVVTVRARTPSSSPSFRNLYQATIRPVGPPLSISLLANKQVQMKWATNYVGYAVECATNLPATAWTTVTSDRRISDGHFCLILDTGGEPRFYRLQTP